MSRFSNPGEILSYSASSKQTGPEGFRILAPAVSYLPALIERWPALGDALGKAPPLIINTYPASLGQFTFGIFVDTYLSVQTGLRALQLAAKEGLSALLMGQPLFLAELLFRGFQQGISWPDSLILASGGYIMPLSLEKVLIQRFTAKSVNCLVLHCYGVAEVDAACLVALERNQKGEILYYPRDSEIQAEISQGRLFLGYQQAMQALQLWDTGDFAVRDDAALKITPSPARLDPSVLTNLESWSESDWERRTGYLAWREGPVCQLREGFLSETENELAHFIFAHENGFSWLGVCQHSCRINHATASFETVGLTGFSATGPIGSQLRVFLPFQRSG